jgi:hypothetical protein
MTDDEFLAELDRLGVAEVRARLARQVYLGGQATLARSWLARQGEVSSAELILLARRASDEAYSANKMAQLALAMAAISIIVAIMAMFHKP